MMMFSLRLLAQVRSIAVAYFYSHIRNAIVLDYVSYSFGVLGMYSHSTRGPELFFLQVVKCFFVFFTYIISLK